MRTPVFLFALFTLYIGFPAQAAQDDIVLASLVEKKYQEMEDVLNNTGKKLSAIRFLHNHISDDATFSMSVDNPTLPHGNPKKKFRINKEQYINSYLDAAGMIDHYNIDIDPVRVDVDQEKSEAVSEEIMTESGLMLNPLNMAAPGKQFTSITKCITHHVLQKDGTLVSKGSDCHTRVNIDTDI